MDDVLGMKIAEQNKHNTIIHTYIHTYKHTYTEKRKRKKNLLTPHMY